MDNNKNLYNAMEAIKRITGYKDQWHTADANGDKATKDSVAKKAQTYYKMLIDSGYSDVADALKNTNNVGAKYIYDTFMKNNTVPTTTTPTTTPTDTSKGVETVKSSMPETPADVNTINGKINDLYGIQRSDRETMAGKYDTLEDYNYNHDPFEDKKNKSIMEQFTFKGKTASDNAIASGGASNGGNIDSYAAANANRQQLAFTNAGVNAVLAEHGATIERARGILTDLGVYQQNQDKGMQTTINQQQTEEQRVFENDETSKNNDVARKVEISNVTGYAPDEWVASNNPYLNDDGTLKDEYKDVDFSAVMAKAKASGNTEAYNQASVARYYKIMGDYGKYGKYDDGNYSVPGKQKTESARQFDENNTTVNKQLDNDKYISEKTLETEEKMNSADNATKLNVANIQAMSEKEIAQLESQAQENETWQDIKKSAGNISDDAETFLNTVVYSMWLNEAHEDIRDVLTSALYDAKNNPKGYKITRNDASNIITNVYGYDKFVLETDEEGNPTKTISVDEWLKTQNWYDPDGESTYTPE